ncbi:hypothetical protein LCL61_33640 [Amycolatopsis coloradensis]|uniref:Uncharacterized protein n=1 Tax=Amycolatopsis coloradensis TaxID=76021 RepID=A0ACD5BMB9_9PSEU
MTLEADEMLLFRNTMRITDGHLEEFTAAVREAIDFVERNAPQVMVQTFVDADRMLAYSYQMYADSDAVLEHWRISENHINAVSAHCTVVDFQVHGSPDERVLAGMRGMIDDGTAVVTPRIAGFVRPLPSPRAGR